MQELILPRRRFLQGLGLFIAAPAIIKIERLMRVVPIDMEALESEVMDEVGLLTPRNTLLTLNMITRESIRLWKNSNAFIQNLDQQYDLEFRVGERLRIKLPENYNV